MKCAFHQTMSLEIAREINVASEKLKEAVERGDFAESSKRSARCKLSS